MNFYSFRYVIKIGNVIVYTGRFGVNTVICKDAVFDPNVGSNVYDNVRIVFITHGHADHFGDAYKIDAKIVAPRLESNMIEDPKINWRGLFNWALLPEKLVTPYFIGNGVNVDDYAENYSFSIPLPGHTYAHTGYIVENVLIAGDSVYPVEYWDEFGVLYYTDPDLAIDSLNKILKLDWDYLIPGHGDVFDRDDGTKLVRENIRRIEQIDKTILSIIDRGGLTESEILSEVVGIFGAKNEKAVLNVLKPAVSGHLSSLYRRGHIDLRLEGNRLVFYRL
jgi:glyoxylase-like metal-dependent hydrolase (beta-lactamase superfamily II)